MFSNYLKRLQNLPENKKKIILWAIVVILGLTMGIFWIRGAINSLSKIRQNMGQIQFPQIDISDMPEIKLPDEESIIQNATPSDQNITPEY